MKILILGSEGFIGKHCIQFFSARNAILHGCDILDLKSPNYVYHRVSRTEPGFDRVFRETQFDYCINAAGSGSVPLSISDPFNDFEANTVDAFKILDAIRQFCPGCRYLNFSSAAVYGNPVQLPVTENAVISPLSPYGWHKYYSELLCKQFTNLYGIKTCSVRPFSVYGPGLKKQIFWDIYQKSLNSSRIELFGNGSESRDFIYITDVVTCLFTILERGDLKGEVYNIGSGNESTIKDAAEKFIGHLNPSVELKFNGNSRQGDPLHWRAEISVISKLGFASRIGLDQGLVYYVQWLNQNE